MFGAARCKAEAITVLAKRCTSFKYNDVGFAFRSYVVFLCSAVRSVRFQFSCFWVCWPNRALRRHHLIHVYKAIMLSWPEGVWRQAYKQALFSHIAGEGVVVCNMHLWMLEKGLFVFLISSWKEALWFLGDGRGLLHFKELDFQVNYRF